MENLWENKIKSRDRYGFLFDKSYKSDVTFLVGPNKDRIQGHKLILSTASPVFNAMFYGQLSETSEEIPIPDIHPEIFTSLLRYIYTDDEPGPDIAFSVLYASKKYLITGLTNACKEVIYKYISEKNVLQMFQDDLALSDDDVIEHCLNVISENTGFVINSKEFLKIDFQLLKQILSLPSITVPEIDIFHKTIEWAKFSCMQKNLTADPKNIRAVLGEALYLIRFPAMSKEEFVNGPIQTQILTDRESLDILMFHIAKKKPRNLPFPTVKRTKIKTPLRVTPHGISIPVLSEEVSFSHVRHKRSMSIVGASTVAVLSMLLFTLFVVRCK